MIKLKFNEIPERKPNRKVIHSLIQTSTKHNKINYFLLYYKLYKYYRSLRSCPDNYIYASYKDDDWKLVKINFNAPKLMAKLTTKYVTNYYDKTFLQLILSHIIDFIYLIF